MIEVIQTSPLEKYTEILIRKSFFKNSSDFISIILLTMFFFKTSTVKREKNNVSDKTIEKNKLLAVTGVIQVICARLRSLVRVRFQLEISGEAGECAVDQSQVIGSL